MAEQHTTNPQSSAPVQLPGIGEYIRLRLGSVRLSAIAAGTHAWEWAAYGVLLLVAAAMRLYELGTRALHHDESLHSFYSWKLSSGDGFVHNPLLHGPFQFEANAAIFFIFGDSDFTSRLLYAVAGTVLVALPFFFRSRLGKLGALFTSVMLAFSPAMLYFSRFARNDILMAVFALGLVICIWRYIDEGKHRYIYIAAALLALAFASKETAYLITALFGLYLVLYLLAVNGPAIVRSANIRYGETRTVNAIFSILSALWRHANRITGLSRPAVLLLILITVTLPLWSAAIGMLQDTPLLSWTNLTFVTSDGSGQVGAPSGGAILIAWAIVVMMLAISMVIGLNWNSHVWAIAAGVFYIIWMPLYTTFFTNLDGLDSGMWHALGYWIAQQDVARGNQPWYYYLIITPLYEFLPITLAIAAAIYYRIKRQADAFTLFLFFWMGMTWLLFTVASEKMPWLVVNVALPIIVLAGKFAGDVVSRIDWTSWKELANPTSLALLVGVPLLVVALYQTALYGTGDASPQPLVGGASVVAVLLLVVGGVFVARKIGIQRFALFAAIPAVLLLFALTVRSGVIASYMHGDVPVEMIVYTQTSPDIVRLSNQFDPPADGLDLAIDSSSGFTWPWAWYLRDNEKYRTSFVALSASTYENDAPVSPVVLVHSSNLEAVRPNLADEYTEAQIVKHRWWFPESTYRNLTLDRIARGIIDREAWRSLADYWLYRKGVRDNIGSENAYVFFKPDFPQEYTPYEHAQE